jgi:hypothetical protein
MFPGRWPASSAVVEMAQCWLHWRPKLKQPKGCIYILVGGLVVLAGFDWDALLLVHRMQTRAEQLRADAEECKRQARKAATATAMFIIGGKLASRA